jgi:hypothetical protein
MMSTFRSLGILNYRVWFIGALVPNIGTCLPRLWLVSMAGANPRAGTADGAVPGASPDDAVER